MENGLSQQSVLSLIRDSKGFIWIGTQDGLNRYDGYTFKSFRYNPGDSATIGDDFVFSLLEEPAGTLWIGTRTGGLFKMNMASETFTAYGLGDAFRNTPKPTVFAIQADESGNLWLGTGAGVLHLNPATGKFQPVELIHGKSSDDIQVEQIEVRTLHIDTRQRVWIGANTAGMNEGRLLRFNPRPFNAFGARIEIEYAGPRARSVQGLDEDLEGRMWAATNGSGLVMVDSMDHDTSYTHAAGDPFSLASDTLRSVYADHSGRVWAGSITHGVSRLDPSSKTFAHFRNVRTDPYSLSHDQVYTFMEDRNGVIWIGTWDGLNGFSPLNDVFELYTEQPGRRWGLEDGRVLAVIEDSNEDIWLGTIGSGLHRFSRKTGELDVYDNDPEDPNSITPNEITSIHEDESGSIWAATLGGISRLVDKKGHFQRFKDTSEVISLYEDGAGDLWFGTYSEGLVRWSRRTGEFTSYPTKPNSANRGHVWPIHEDRTGVLWVGAYDEGLYRLDRSAGRLVRHAGAHAHPDSLKSNHIYALLEDTAGSLWVGTGEGLSRLDPARRTFKTYTTEDGLAFDFVASIREDDNGFLWVSTNNGLSRFDPRSGSFRTFKLSAGLQSNQFFSGSSFKNDRGELFFGGPGGLTIFDPRRIPPSRPPSTVVLTDFRVLSGSLFHLPVDPAPIRLNHDQTFLTLSVSTLDFTDASQIHYRYKLEPHNGWFTIGPRPDIDWVDMGTRPEITFSHIPHGTTYTLTVQAARADSVWPENGQLQMAWASNGLVFTLDVKAPFYDTWWFYGLLTLMLVAVITALYLYRMQQLLRVERLRHSIASDLHDLIGVTLSSISARTQMILARNGLDEPSRSSLDVISRLSRSAVSMLRGIVWVVEPQYETLNEVVSNMENTAVQLLEGALPYRVQRPPDIPAQPVSIEFRQHVFLLYLEALQNVLKHARASSVSIEIGLHAGVLSIRVEDDGIGFTEAGTRAGMGLHNMRERAEKIGGRLAIQSEPGAGTTVKFEVRVT